MADGAAAVLVIGLLFAVGGGFVLYAMVRAEHDDRTVTDRASAERIARKDTDDRE